LRAQRRLFEPLLSFRPQAMPAQREKRWMMRAELAHELFRDARSGATLRLVAGFGRGEAVEGFLGETLADTARVRDGELYPMEGDVLGFTFADFRFPFEDAFTDDRWAARLDSMRANPALNYLTPFETVINPATGRPFTEAEAIDAFDMLFDPDNPYGLFDFRGTGPPGYWRRTERVAYLRAGLDLDLGPAHRLGIGGEVLRTVAEELGVVGSGVRSLLFGGAYHVEPTLAALWATDRLRAGPVALELGLRADVFTADARFPAIPGFVLPLTSGGTTYEPEFVDQETSVRLSPRAAAAVPVGPIRVRASYGHYAKAPAFDLMYAGTNADLTKVPAGQVFGRRLEPGHTETFEVGLTWRPDARTAVDIAGYQREGIDRPTPTVFAANHPVMGRRIVTSVSNLGADRSRAVELRIGRRIGEGVEVRVGYAYLSAEMMYRSIVFDPLTGEPLPGSVSTFTSDFDRPHTLSLLATAATPAGAAGDGVLRRLVSDWAPRCCSRPHPDSRTRAWGWRGRRRGGSGRRRIAARSGD
jgi:outer membrane receptor protein involved in Fe transport